MCKKKIIFLSIIFILSILCGCSEVSFIVQNSNYRYGVIETTGQENRSYISFYDANLKKIGEKSIKYGSMGDGFSLPIVFDNHMFIVPKGIYHKKELTFVMSYDLFKGKVEKYNTGLQNMNNISVDEDNVYSVNTMNNITSIVKYNRKTQDLSKKEMPEVYIGYIEIYGNKLFAFGEGEEAGKIKSYLYIFDSNTLDILEKVDISNIGFGQYYTVMKGDKLYFPTSFSIEATDGLPTNKLSEYNHETGQIITYTLKENYPFQIMEYEDKLLITHFDPVAVKGNKVSIFDVKDGSSDVIEFNHNIEQLELDGENVIILGDGYLYKYDSKFSLINSTKVINDRDSNCYYYTTGFFKRIVHLP